MCQGAPSGSEILAVRWTLDQSNRLIQFMKIALITGGKACCLEYDAGDLAGLDGFVKQLA